MGREVVGDDLGRVNCQCDVILKFMEYRPRKGLAMCE